MEVNWWFEPASNATKTFALSYVAHGAVRQYPTGDQAYWKAVYADRAGPVQSGTVTVHLLADTPADQPSALYVIDKDGNEVREVGPGQRPDARTVSFTLPVLQAGTGAEARVQFPHGLITTPPPPWQAAADRADAVRQTVAPIATFLALLLSLAIVVGGGVGLFMLWYTRGREPAIGAVPPILDQPPSDLPAPLAGTLVDGRADLQDAVAALVDLGDRGILTMTEIPGPPSDVLVTLHRATDDPTLRPYERVLLTALFDAGSTSGEIRLSMARTRFAAAVPVLQDRLHAAVAAEGLFTENPKQVRQRYIAFGVLLSALGMLLAFGGAWLLYWASGIIWLPGILLAIGGGVLAFDVPGDDPPHTPWRARSCPLARLPRPPGRRTAAGTGRSAPPGLCGRLRHGPWLPAATRAGRLARAELVRPAGPVVYRARRLLRRARRLLRRIAPWRFVRSRRQQWPADRSGRPPAASRRSVHKAGATRSPVC